MLTKLLFFVLILLHGLINLSSGFVIPNEGNINLAYIGSVDGKSFFIQMLPPSTWEEVRTFCNESGMRMASITSTRQRDLIVNANQEFEGTFWTSGGDAQSPAQFIWENIGVLNSSVVDELALASQKPITCVTFRNYGETEKSYQFMSFPSQNPRRILCEVVHSQ